MPCFLRIIALATAAATAWGCSRGETRTFASASALAPAVSTGVSAVAGAFVTRAARSTTANAARSARAGNPTGAAADVDPAATKAIEQMGAYLQTLKAFQVAAHTTRDEVQDDGQRVTYGGLVDLIVQRPNRLRAEVTSDRQQRMYFYDGKSFSLWARRVNYYATVPAPSTLKELGELLQSKYDIEVPLADLFYWGEEGHDVSAIKAAQDIGLSQIEGVSCGHYAYRQDDVDWQVWIQLGSYPLPRKIVITTRSDPERPQYSSVLTWNLAPSYNDEAFTFEPPADAHKITFAEPR